MAYVRSLPEKAEAGGATPPSTEQRLAFYALYKQATQGPQPATAKRPNALDPTGQFKYDAWRTLGDMTADEAKRRYVDTLALVVLCGAASESRRGDAGGWYGTAMRADTPPPFLKCVLKPLAGAHTLPVWALGGDFAEAVAASEELPLKRDDALQLGALKQQALFGDVNIAKPGLLASFATTVTAVEWCVPAWRVQAAALLTAAELAHRTAWSALKGTTREAAMEAFIARVAALQAGE